MTTGMEGPELIEPWIWSTLTNDPTITELVGAHVYGALTPDDPGGAYVTFSMQSMIDIRGVGQATWSVEGLYAVKAVAETTSQDDLVPIVARITTLLAGVDVDVGGGHITSTRESFISYPEVNRREGIAFLHLGVQLRIRANSN